MDTCSDKNWLIGPKLDIEIDQRGVGAYLFDMCEKHGDRICQIDADAEQHETFTSIKQRSIRVAIEMTKFGIKEGDVVSMFTHNILENMIIFTASQFIGAKIASLDPIMTPKELAHLISLATPKIIFAQESYLEVLVDALEEVQHSPEIIVIGNSNKYKTFHKFLAEKEAENTFKPIRIRDVKTETSTIFFTSGSTGLSKAICISHDSVLQSAVNFLTKMGEIPKVMFHVSTMFWISGVLISMATFVKGSCKVFTSNDDAENLAKVIQKYKVEFCFLASFYSYKLIIHPNMEKYDFSSVKLLYFSGAGVPVHRILKCRKVLRNENIALGFGMTELGGFAISFSVGEMKLLAAKKPASSGTVLPSVIVKIVDIDTGKTLGVNQAGEIRIKMPTIMLGYYNQDCSSEFDEENFFKTGDLGYYDEDKCVYIVNRIKEMFTFQSHVILPAAIEAVLLKHDAVEQAVVYGVPDEVNENLPAASVVLREDAKITEEELIDFVNNRVGDREKLRGGLKIIHYIPRTPTGKVNRKKFLSTINK